MKKTITIKNSEIMTHLSYNEFTKLMENRGETWVHTEDADYRFYGINKASVAVEQYIRLKDIWQIGKKDHLIWSEIITMTEAQCMYMSLNNKGGQ